MTAHVLFTGKWSATRLRFYDIDPYHKNIPDWLLAASDEQVSAFLTTAYRLRGSFIVKTNASVGNPFARWTLDSEPMVDTAQKMLQSLGVLTKPTTRPDSRKYLLDTSGTKAYRRLREFLNFDGDSFMLEKVDKADTAARQVNHVWGGTEDAMVDTVVMLRG